MKILIIHNYYQQAGGEDNVLAAERQILESKGHQVIAYTVHNAKIDQKRRIRLVADTVWSYESYRTLRLLINKEKPHLIHFHNFFPLVSPSAFDAAFSQKVPVVQTLHNYRLLCPNAVLMRNGRVCTACLKRNNPLFGVLHGCYRGSRSASAVIGLMLLFHKIRGTWQTRIDRYIALTEFARQTFVIWGLPEKKLVVKPNFIDPDPGIGTGQGKYALFVGRLSTEKGVRTLLEAWSKRPCVPLKVAGDGPLLNEARAFVQAHRLESVELLGRVEHAAVLELMKSANFLVLPSECYENFPLTIAEAYACGLPVIASRLGAMEELVLDGETGLHFTPGDSDDLAAKVSQAWGDKDRCIEMGRCARAEYEAKYTAERNYQQLLEIYHQAIQAKSSC